jgi:hypothetical protein
MTNKSITVKYLARVEGEGALNIQIKDNAVTGVQLKIFEPPRFFEAFLRGRNFTEAPDIFPHLQHLPRGWMTGAPWRPPWGDDPGPIGPCGGCSAAVDRVPASTSSCSMPRLPGVPGRHPDGPGPSGHGKNGAQVKEGGK